MNRHTFTAEQLLPISGLQHLLFCRRRAALVHIEGLWRDNIFTTTGSINQQTIDEARPFESRPGVRITRGLLVSSHSLGLTGKCDVVEYHPPKAKGLPETPFPIEHKRGHLRPEPGYLLQLCAQAVCLEEMTGTAVPRGGIFFAKNRRRLSVEFSPELRLHLRHAAHALHKLVARGRTPPPRYDARCNSCSMINLCQPKGFGGLPGSLGQYLIQKGGGSA